MVKFEDDVNVNIYNLYHKRMLNKRTQYVYVFSSYDGEPYIIQQVDFKDIEDFYDTFKERIYTMETNLNKVIRIAEDIIIEDLKQNTDYLQGEYGETFSLNFYLETFGVKKILDCIIYDYNPKQKERYNKSISYIIKD